MLEHGFHLGRRNHLVIIIAVLEVLCEFAKVSFRRFDGGGENILYLALSRVA